MKTETTKTQSDNRSRRTSQFFYQFWKHKKRERKILRKTVKKKSKQNRKLFSFSSGVWSVVLWLRRIRLKGCVRGGRRLQRRRHSDTTTTKNTTTRRRRPSGKVKSSSFSLFLLVLLFFISQSFSQSRFTCLASPSIFIVLWTRTDPSVCPPVRPINHT